MEGAQGQPVRVVFDTAAGVCLWTQQTILQGDLNCWIDRQATKTLAGIGGAMGSTPCVVSRGGKNIFLSVIPVNRYDIFCQIQEI